MKKILKSFRLSEECIAQIEERDKKFFESGSDFLETAVKYFVETSGGNNGVDSRELLSKIDERLKEVNETFAKIETLFASQADQEWRTQDNWNVDDSLDMIDETPLL